MVSQDAAPNSQRAWAIRLMFGVMPWKRQSTSLSSARPAARMPMLAGLRRVRVRRTVLALLVLLLACGCYFRYRYKGFTTAFVKQLRYTSLDENKNLFFCISYWLDFIQKLKLNSEGFYSFDDTDERGMNGFERGKLLYHQGDFASGISQIEQDIRTRGESESKVFWLAMCHLRYAEAENCLPKLLGDGRSSGSHMHGQMCSLPITQFHDRAEISRRAAQLFEDLLEHYDQKNRLYQWLLNFSYMTIDGFPQEVPPKYLIKSDFINAFYGDKKREVQSRFADLVFDDNARELGVDNYTTGRGVAVEDFDKDGFLDIVTGGNFGLVKYYKNDQGKGFKDVTGEAGLSGIKQPFSITAADYDNDGWVDLFIARPFGNYKLYRNNQNGTFSDVTASSGLLDGQKQDEIDATWIPAWGDVNNDGYPDLFVSQWGLKIPFTGGIMAKPRVDSKLFINEKGHFVDRTQEYGLADIVEDQYFIGAAFGDYDLDGYPDLFLSSPLRNTSVLLKNVSGRRFEPTDLIRRAEGGFSVAFVDINHDGRLDIFQAGFADAKTSTEMTVFGENLSKYHSGHSTLFIQTADGRFVERTGLFDMPMSTMGASFGDVNNDGCYDFYLGKGDPEGWFVLPNLMYVGETDCTKCAERFTNISMLNGFGTIQKGHGIVFFDFNNDGKQDVFSSLGGMWPSDSWTSQFFVNKSRLTNSWIKIRLRGRKTNYFGMGATIRVAAENAKGEEIVRYYNMDNKTGFGSAPYLAHIGLMNATRVKSVQVFWPASARWKSYVAELNRMNVFDEDEGSQVGPPPECS